MNTTIKNKIIAIIIFSFLFSVAFWYLKKLFYYPVNVTIEIECDASETCQLFYDTGKGFNGDECLTKIYDTPKNFRIISFELPRVKIQNIRIDPAINSPKIIVKEITIKVGSESISYLAPNILNHFKLNNLTSSGIVGKTIILNRINTPDAQLILNTALNQIFELEQSKAKSIFFVFITMLYLTLLSMIILYGVRIYSTYMRWMQSLNFRAEIAINSEKAIRYLQKNKIIIIFSFLVAIFSYGYELFNFSLSIDEEIESFKTASDAYIFIIVGRWGLYFLKLFFQPSSVIPFYSTIIALSCLSVSSIVFVTKSQEKLSSMMIFSMLYISNPIHSYYLSFNNSGLYYTMGLLLTTIAYFIFRHTIENGNSYLRNFFFTILLLGFSISLYQSHLIFFLVFVVYFVFVESLSPKGLQINFLWRIIKWLLVVISLSLIFYKIGDLITRYLFLPENPNNSTYLENFSKWGEKTPNEVFRSIFQEIITYLTGTDVTGEILGLSLKSIPVVVFFIIIKVIISKHSIQRKIISSVLLFVLVLSTFLLVFYTGGKLPIRAMIPLTLMIALLWLTWYKQAGSFLRRLLFLVALLILINNTWINTRLFYTSYTSWQADRDIAIRIIERIYQFDPPIIDGKIKVAFLGNYKYEQNELFFKSETHGASFFEWDPGTQHRISPFFKTTGINELETVSLDLLKDYKTEIENMPAWPRHGSVKLFDDIVLVKLSEPTIP